MSSRIAALFATLLSLASGSAAAVVVSIDADAFAAGTDVSHLFPGVTLSASGGGVDGAIYSRTSALASTGTRVFGPAPPGGLIGFGTSPGIVFRADFATPTSFVAIDTIPDDGFDPATLSAFDAGGNLLATFSTAGDLGAGIAEVASITRTLADIAFVTVFDTSNNFLLDNLRFEAGATGIGEPASLALLPVVALLARRGRPRGTAA